MDIGERINSAFKHYQEGNFEESEKECMEIIALQPENSEVLHLLALTSHMMGKHESAVEHLQKALRIEPENADYLYDLGNILHDQGRLDEAAEAYKAAISLEPEHTNAYNNLGMVSHDRGSLDEAIGYYEKALALSPHEAMIHNNIALAYQEKGELTRAIAHYGKAIQLEPEYADAYYNMGRIFMEEGNLDPALMYFRKAADLNPSLPEAFLSMAHILVRKGRYREAIPLLEGLSTAYPDSAEIHNNFGNALSEVWLLDDALGHLKTAVELNPHFAEAHSNLGNTLGKMGKIEEGIWHVEKALQLDPDLVEAIINLGTLYKEKGLFRDAVTCYEKAILLDPENADARFNRSLIDLATGRFAEGWEGYEWRWRARHSRERVFPQQLWNGEPLEGKTLFIYSEQGVGDEIMFASCVPDMVDRAGLCLVECDERLVPLFERSFPSARIVKKLDGDRYRTDLPRADYRIAAGSLPRFTRRTLSSFPSRPAYLVPSPEKVAEWREKYEAIGKGPKVGISWRGGSTPDVKRVRSVRLDRWSGLFSLEGIHWIDIQYGDHRDERESAEKESGIRIHFYEEGDPLKDLDGFAAKLAALDLVISVDNATVHLSGALGVPTWVLLPYVCEWRWLRDCEDAPWYESVRLFRQRLIGEWGEVFELVERRLASLAKLSSLTRSALVFPVERSFRGL